jgi:hypothetical protein
MQASLYREDLDQSVGIVALDVEEDCLRLEGHDGRHGGLAK